MPAWYVFFLIFFLFFSVSIYLFIIGEKVAKRAIEEESFPLFRRHLVVATWFRVVVWLTIATGVFGLPLTLWP